MKKFKIQIVNGLKQQKFIVSYVRVPEPFSQGQNQGDNKIYCRPLQEICSLSFLTYGGYQLSLVYGHVTPISVHVVMLPSPLLSGSKYPLLLTYKDTVRTPWVIHDNFPSEDS